MLQTKFKNQHEKTKIYTFQNFQFHFHYRVISENVLIKTQKPQLCYCPDGLLVKLSVFQAERAGSNPTCLNFFSFFHYARKVSLHVSELFRLFLKDTNIEAVSDTTAVCALQQTVHSI